MTSKIKRQRNNSHNLKKCFKGASKAKPLKLLWVFKWHFYATSSLLTSE